jgi:dTMP kinase
MSGLFISFEGIDGAGKSSHLEALADAFRAQARPAQQVILTREPGGTPLSEKLREMVLHESMDALTEALLVFAARREHVLKVIAPALSQGQVVLCDRFTDASFAYQGAGRGFSLDTLSFLEQTIQSIPQLEGRLGSTSLLQPDLTLLFDVPPQVAAERLSKARSPDKFEAQSQEFFERVAAGYTARVNAQPQRFVRINGHQERERVRAEVMQAMKSRGYLK